MTPIPDTGTSVVLRDQAGGAYRSEVTRSAPGQLLLAPPPDLEAGQLLRPGTRLLVSWPDQQSLWVLPVMLVSAESDTGTGPLIAEIDGDAWREERRHYVRAALPATLELEYDVPGLTGDAAVRLAEGELIDLSEVALRCILAPEHQQLCEPRTPVSVRLNLDGDLFELPSFVLLGKPAARLDLGLELVVLFDRPVARVEELRAYLAESAERRAVSGPRA